MNDISQADTSETHYPPKVVLSQAEMEELLEELLRAFARNVTVQMRAQRLGSGVLAERAAMAAKTLNNVLSGRHKSRIDILINVGIALDVPFWTLWLPEAPIDPAYARTFSRLQVAASKLSLASLERVARTAEFELADQKPKE